MSLPFDMTARPQQPADPRMDVLLLGRLLRQIDVALPVESDTGVPDWLILRMDDPAAPIVAVTRDPSEGECLTPVFFVAFPSAVTLAAVGSTIGRRTGGLARFAYGTRGGNGLWYLVLPPLFHLVDPEDFVERVTLVLRQEERGGGIAWTLELCTVLIADEGGSFSRHRGADGRIHVEDDGRRHARQPDEERALPN